MRLKVSIHQYLNKKEKNIEKISKILFPVDNPAPVKNGKDSAFKVQDMLSKICLQLKIEKEAFKIEADYNGFSLLEDSPIHLLFKDDDEIRIFIKPKSTKNKPINDSICKTNSLSKSNIESASSEKKQKRFLDDSAIIDSSKNNSKLTGNKSKKKHKPKGIEQPTAQTNNVSSNIKESSNKAESEPNKPLLTISKINLNDSNKTEHDHSKKKEKNPSKPHTQKEIVPLDPSSLPSVDLLFSPPCKDQLLLFKISELGPDYTPVISEFKKARVLEFEPTTETITYELIDIESSPEKEFDNEGNPILRKFEFPDPSFIAESDGVSVEYLLNPNPAVCSVPFSYLVDPRHFVENK